MGKETFYDDTDWLQAMIDKAIMSDEARIIIPPGKYKISKPLRFRSKEVLIQNTVIT